MAGEADKRVTDQTDAEPVASTELAELSESALVAACLAGRAGAFDLVVERHRRPVYQLCYRFVGNHEDASDLSQDVFLRAYRGLGKFRGSPRSQPGLPRIGINVSESRCGQGAGRRAARRAAAH